MNYDHIVVGAGSAGAIIASRLTEDPNRSVLLLEAGPDYPDLDEMPADVKYGYGHGKSAIDVLGTEHRWHFVAKSTDQAPPMLVPRGKTTGGSSAVNAQIFLRGVPEDYDDWASWGNDEWSFQKLIPFFRRMETDTDFSDDFHGVDGPTIIRRYKPDEWLPDQQAWYRASREYGFPDCPDHNDPDSTGVGPAPFNNPNRIRWSTNIGYLSEARDRPNLTIVSRALAHRIIFDGVRATGVEYEADGEVQSARGDEIILSAGAIGSPHLLMLSAWGPLNTLRAWVLRSSTIRPAWARTCATILKSSSHGGPSLDSSRTASRHAYNSAAIHSGRLVATERHAHSSIFVRNAKPLLHGPEC